jgi:hypothetical protein
MKTMCIVQTLGTVALAYGSRQRTMRVPPMQHPKLLGNAAYLFGEAL